MSSVEKLNAKRTPASWLGALWRVGWEYRYNVRASQDEYKRTEEPADCWRQGNDRLVSHLITLSNEHTSWGGKPIGREGWQTLANATWEVSEVDPFIEWLDDLPEWDRKPRLGRMFEMCFYLKPGQDPDLLAHAAYSILGGAISRAYDPGCKHDETVVILGPRGLGKSVFVRDLLPSEHANEWFTDDVSLEYVGEQKSVEVTIGTVFVELAELTGIRRADVEKYKAWATRRYDKVRLAYRRNAETIPRRWVAIGTTNKAGGALPSDLAAGRRLIPVELEGGIGVDIDARREDLQGPYGQQLWAEAMHKYRAGHPRWLHTPQLADAADNAYHLHRIEEPLETRLQKLRDSEDKEWTFEELGMEVGLTVLNGRDRYQLVDALANLGWPKVRRGKQKLTFYTAPAVAGPPKQAPLEEF